MLDHTQQEAVDDRPERVSEGTVTIPTCDPNDHVSTLLLQFDLVEEVQVRFLASTDYVVSSSASETLHQHR